MINIRNLKELECFMAVVQQGSFSKAAERLEVSKNSVSRFVANLEERLGENVFRRSTRKVYLTGFGERLFRRTEKFWESLEVLESELSSVVPEPQGTLRIIASNTLSSRFLYDKLKRFQGKYPSIRTEIDFSDRGAETWKLDERDIDILFGFPHVPKVTDEWKYKKLGDVRNLLVAAPSLLEQREEPLTQEDLLHVPFLTHVARKPRNVIPLARGKGVMTSEPRVIVNSFTHMKELCVAGMGVALMGDNMVETELREGSLRVVLPELPYKVFPLHAFCRASEYALPKVRAFMDFF